MDRIGRGIQTPARAWLFSGLLLLVVGSLALQATSCVDTAECNESVTCSPDEVCYEFSCYTRCASDDDCDADEDCTPCMPPDAVDSSGRCFGSEASACLPQD